MDQREILSFKVLTVECVACTPIFKRELCKIPGVTAVKPLVMFNQIIVEVDLGATTKDEVKRKVLEIAEKAGLKQNVVFHN